MECYPSSFIRQCSLILYAICFVKLGCHAQNSILNLDEGDVCYISDTTSSNNYICRRIEDCMIVGAGIHKNIRPQLCSFIGLIPIVCCPSNYFTVSSSPSPQSYPKRPSRPIFASPLFPLNSDIIPSLSSTPSSLNFPGPLRRPRPDYPRQNHTSRPKRPLESPNPMSTQGPNYKQPKAAHSAIDMCHEYSKLIYNDTSLQPLSNENTKNKTVNIRDCIYITSEKFDSKDFPHMVLLGYEEQPIYDNLHCGGSLISKRWVLTAGHCEKTGLSNFATWARVGGMDFNTELDNKITYNYKIDKRIIHPNYKENVSYYDDVALFRLERDVQFSPYVRPLCLNTDQSLNPSKLLATIWEYDNYDVEVIANLETLVLNHVPNDQCNRLYSNNDKLLHGIDDTSMICAANLKVGIDTCEHDSGGPLQVSNPNYTCVYTQIGLTSFGANQCSMPDNVIVYTRISNYISWIEPIVWPKDD